jgi:hypothetical protein
LHEFLQLFLTSGFPQVLLFQSSNHQITHFLNHPTPSPYVDPIRPKATQGHPRIGRGSQPLAKYQLPTTKYLPFLC